MGCRNNDDISYDHRGRKTCDGSDITRTAHKKAAGVQSPAAVRPFNLRLSMTKLPTPIQKNWW